jgi:hypothetical protein
MMGRGERLEERQVEARQQTRKDYWLGATERR